MTALIPDAELNAMTDAYVARIHAVSIHKGNPGPTGANETVGLARKTPTFWPAGQEGPLGPDLQPATLGVAWSDALTFSLAAGTYTHFGLWDALTLGSTFRGANAFATPVVVSTGGLDMDIVVGVGPFAAA